jgi:hypothetical protein
MTDRLRVIGVGAVERQVVNATDTPISEAATFALVTQIDTQA